MNAGAEVEGPGISKEQAERDLEALRDRIESIHERLQADREDRGELERRVEDLDREIARLAAGIRRTERRQAEVQREIDDLSDQMRGLRDKLEAHRERVAELAYSMYVMGRPSRLKLFLNQRDPAVVSRMLGYHDYIVAARARTIERINAWTEELAALSAQQESRSRELEELAAGYRSEQEALQARRDERSSALAALNERIAASESELARLKENESRLQGVIEEIEAYLSSRRRHGITEGAFRAMKGKLRLPVSAPLSARFGDTRSTGVKWDGIMLRPPGGAEVEAIFEGRVVFADWLRGFGLLLIIDHGDGFMSLYSHNEALFKGVGDWVDTREVIAAAGNSGGLDRPGLYFEIRNNGEPQDPLSWCRTG
ncbi:MAG TPA: peptidoglycan DD-metalloendopeptidase family protein [Arenicellales bacterium]|nr:peptidoglycan DD-metalloendopeptidase family protein [Arenicellales bacterium]